jgi:hypothetical protein
VRWPIGFLPSKVVLGIEPKTKFTNQIELSLQKIDALPFEVVPVV